MWYFPFSVWPTSVRVAISGSIRPNDVISFSLMAEWHFTVCMCHVFPIPLSVDISVASVSRLLPCSLPHCLQQRRRKNKLNVHWQRNGKRNVFLKKKEKKRNVFLKIDFQLYRSFWEICCNKLSVPFCIPRI